MAPGCQSILSVQQSGRILPGVWSLAPSLLGHVLPPFQLGGGAGNSSSILSDVAFQDGTLRTKTEVFHVMWFQTEIRRLRYLWSRWDRNQITADLRPCECEWVSERWICVTTQVTAHVSLTERGRDSGRSCSKLEPGVFFLMISNSYIISYSSKQQSAWAFRFWLSSLSNIYMFCGCFRRSTRSPADRWTSNVCFYVSQVTDVAIYQYHLCVCVCVFN